MTEAVRTPCYIFNKKDFKERIRMVAEALPGIPLTYSIKANSFLIAAAPEQIRHLEVCSPGELAICERLKVDPKRIIYSGVMKENTDVAEAIRYPDGRESGPRADHRGRGRESRKECPYDPAPFQWKSVWNGCAGTVGDHFEEGGISAH